MERRKVCVEIAASRGTYGHSVQRARRCFVRLGLVGALITGGVVHSSVLLAQVELDPGILTVRPHQMTIGARTVQAGKQALESLDGSWVYVPKQCVGTQRCPLVVSMHGDPDRPTGVVDGQCPYADKYGMILLAPKTTTEWMSLMPNGAAWLEKDGIDSALKQVLEKYAIDPDKIALLGTMEGGSYSLLLGRNNVNVFSRVAVVSPMFPYSFGTPYFEDGAPRNTTTQFFILGGLSEVEFVSTSFLAARQLRKDGNPVEQVLMLHGYKEYPDDIERMWQWLQESWTASNGGWTTSNGATQAVPRADSMPILTTGSLTALITFWNRFMKEPDSIRMAGREANQKRVAVLLGDQQVSMTMMDATAMAAKYPSVAADLKKAGLTAKQAEAYRIALISAAATRRVRARETGASPVLKKNMESFRGLRDQLKLLWATGIWTTP